MRRPALLAAALLALPLLALPAPAAASGQAVPWPQAGEVFYYQGTVAHGDDEPSPTELALRFLGPLDVRDGAGALRKAYAVEVTRPWDRLHGHAEALLADPEARRALAYHDLATLERVEARITHAAVEASPALGGPVDVLALRHGGASTLREFLPPGVPDPYAVLWGAPLPEGPLPMAWPVGSARGSWGWAAVPQALEPAGAGASAYDMPRGTAGPRLALVTFEPLGAMPWGGGEARGFRGAYDASVPGEARAVARELWMAPDLAMPVKERLEQVLGEGRGARTVVVELALAQHLPGEGPLPWGQAPPADAPGPALLGPLGPDGPADGGAGLAYPLAEAVAAARADPTLLGYQRLAAGGPPVLVKAVHQLRPGGSVGAPLPEARWLLLFQGPDGAGVTVESKRPLGAAGVASVQREQARNVFLSPDIEGVRPSELPASAPTFAAALRAWERHRLGDAPAADSVAYFLQRMEDGRVLPIVWAGVFRSHHAAGQDGLGHELTMSLVGLDERGEALLAVESASLWGYGVGPALARPAAAPPPPRGQAPAPDPVPALAAAGLGLTAAAGLGLKLLAPLYARLDRRRVLEHPTRRALLALVREEPGVHLDAARSRLGVGAGQASHHVHVLLQAGLLREQRAGRFRRLYPADAPPLAAQRDAVLRQPRAAALYDLARRQPGVGLREASRALGVPPSSLQWHADRLEQAGLLQRRAGDGLHPLA